MRMMEHRNKISFQVRESRLSLVAGALSIAFAVFIFAMRLLHPKGEGGVLFLYLPLLLMLAGGVFFFVVYRNKSVTVDEMSIRYVNFIKKEKAFTLDEIGFGSLETGGGKITLRLYDLMGDRLCKLDFGMRGMGEFLQYLVDNGVKIEEKGSRPHRQGTVLPELILKEKAVCEEEIPKETAAFYGEAEQIFRDWEKRNKRFAAEWELGFAEYRAQDLEREAKRKGRTGIQEWAGAWEDGTEEIPEDYVCVLEAYLKRDGEYVVDRGGKAVAVQIPYLSRCRSYRLGEDTRIRKSDEEILKEETARYLEMLSEELPRHKYRTEAFRIRHTLRRCAGLPAGKNNIRQ